LILGAKAHSDNPGDTMKSLIPGLWSAVRPWAFVAVASLALATLPIAAACAASWWMFGQ
jgi:hypothetical protein